MRETKFLGRTFNTNTMMWEFSDGSGVSFPEELRQDMLTDMQETIGGSVAALIRKWKYEQQHKA